MQRSHKAEGRSTKKRDNADSGITAEEAAYGYGLTPDEYWRSTPAELQTFLDGKVKIRKMHTDALLQHLDRMQATNAANIMSMQGRVAEKPIPPEECMAFQWDKNDSQVIVEMTEEDMTRFDQNMDAWGGVRPHG